MCTLPQSLYIILYVCLFLCIADGSTQRYRASKLKHYYRKKVSTVHFLHDSHPRIQAASPFPCVVVTRWHTLKSRTMVISLIFMEVSDNKCSKYSYCTIYKCICFVSNQVKSSPHYPSWSNIIARMGSWRRRMDRPLSWSSRLFALSPPQKGKLQCCVANHLQTKAQLTIHHTHCTRLLAVG